jgi:acid phosphatase (class A)
MPTNGAEVALLNSSLRRSTLPIALKQAWIALQAAALALALLAGCAAPPAAVPELRPGVPAGYLPRNALPDSLALLPPPPAADSAAFAADEEAYRSTRGYRNTARWAQATKDANLRFPAAAETFSCALGAPITPEATPRLYMLMRRSLVDAGLSTYTAKDHYQRTRPFVVFKETSCTPAEEAALAKDGSYPSGHAALGWGLALLLTELAPERADALLARGEAFGQSRVICGVHWQSDVNAGRLVAAGAIAKLHADATFRADVEAAKGELAAVRAKGLPPTGDCNAEAAALAAK